MGGSFATSARAPGTAVPHSRWCGVALGPHLHVGFVEQNPIDLLPGGRLVRRGRVAKRVPGVVALHLRATRSDHGRTLD